MHRPCLHKLNQGDAKRLSSSCVHPSSRDAPISIPLKSQVVFNFFGNTLQKVIRASASLSAKRNAGLIFALRVWIYQAINAPLVLSRKRRPLAFCLGQPVGNGPPGAGVKAQPHMAGQDFNVFGLARGLVG